MLKTSVAIFLGAVFIFLFFYFQGYGSSIGWKVTTTAEPESFYTLPFKKGPFQFSFSGEKYSLAEVFSAGPIERHFSMDAALLSIMLAGLCLVLAVATSLPRVWFVGTMGLFIFFIISLHLPEIRLFGFGERSSLAIVVILLAYLGPAYFFHAFAKYSALGWRWLTFLIISGAVVLLSGVEMVALQEQFISGSYFGMIVLSLVFLFLIAEENVFAILFLVTQAKGGRNNHVHFSVFSLVYLGVLIAYYGKKSALLDLSWLELGFFDPFILLAISTVVALWSLRFKRAFYEGFLALPHAGILYCGLGAAVLAFFALAFFRGNDPVYEGMHYFIVYAHLGFGLMFFLYLFWNFVSPLGQGMQVYKIAYKEQNFPYVSARLAGLAAIAGFFFLANKEPFLLFRAGHYNYLGAQQEATGEDLLAGEYYREGSIYGYDNHFSNYKIGYRELQKGDIAEANYRFKRAAMRYPSPQAFINQAGTHAMQGEATPSLVTLQSGLRVFPGNSQLINNLGLTYADMGKSQEAANMLSLANPNAKWANTALVNLWKVAGADTSLAARDYEKGNLAVKANILNTLTEQAFQADIRFDTTSIYPSYPLHRLAFLINASWYFDTEGLPAALEGALSGQMDESMYLAARNAMVMTHYRTGNINKALELLDILRTEASYSEAGRYTNQMGLIALSQHATRMALGFFEEAIKLGFQDALLNKAACLLELGRLDEASEWAGHLTTLDTAYSRLEQDISRIRGTENLSLDQQLFRVYYLYTEYSPAELSVALAQADELFIRSLWAKVASEQLKLENYEQLKLYRAVFNNHLNKVSFEEPDLLMALAEEKTLDNGHPLAQALTLDNPEEKASALSGLASLNALNEPLVLAISQQLMEQMPSAAYDVLVQAININRSSVALHQQYVLAALETGLEAYAEDVLQKLQTLTTQQEYQKFYQKYLSRKAELDTSTSW